MIVVQFESYGLKMRGGFVKSGPKAVLFLHGAGKSGPERYTEWQKRLGDMGYSSLAFSFRGVGESEGVFEDGSLENRLTNAMSAVEFLKSKGYEENNMVISGSSMGGHVAVRIVEKYPGLGGLILLCGAVYGREAEDKKLNESFSQVIRKENSWSDSIVFDILQTYQKPVLVVYGERETVIPEAVRNRLKELITDKGKYIVMPNIGHNLMVPQGELEHEAHEKLFGEVVGFLHDIWP